MTSGDPRVARKGGRPATGQGVQYTFRGPGQIVGNFRQRAGAAPAVLVQFMRWYLRLPGAELPERPPAPVSEPDSE